MNNHTLLSIEEKRLWLAKIFRDDSGEYSQSDKFKALIEDTKLAAVALDSNSEKPSPSPLDNPLVDILKNLPPAEMPIQLIDSQKI